jgi:hypothetical protein
MGIRRMRLYAFFFILFSLAAAPAAAERPNLADPAYTVCRASTDCAIVYPPCGAPAAVNKPHERQVAAWYDHLRPHAQCAPWLKLPEAGALSCVKNRCTVALVEEPKDAPPEEDRRVCESDADCVAVVEWDDCCDKHFINGKYADRLRAEIEYNKRIRFCPAFDRRHVKNLRCENRQCTADLEAPLELPGMLLKLRGKCEQ